MEQNESGDDLGIFVKIIVPGGAVQQVRYETKLISFFVCNLYRGFDGSVVIATASHHKSRELESCYRIFHCM